MSHASWVNTEKKKKVIELMKDELCKKIMKEFAELRAKAYSYLTENNNKDKKSKRHKQVRHKKKT